MSKPFPFVVVVFAIHALYNDKKKYAERIYTHRNMIDTRVLLYRIIFDVYHLFQCRLMLEGFYIDLK